MADRTYTIQRFDPPSARSRCFQVRLKLEGDTFQLSVAEYYNDWGDRAQDGTTYRGNFSETADEVRCISARKRVVDIYYDHDGRADYVRKKKQSIEDRCVFVFPKTEDGELVCTVEYKGFKGQAMSTEVEPVKDLFR